MKAQITLFIIIGIIILFALTIPFLFIAERPSPNQQVKNSNIKQVSEYVEECLSQVSAEGLKLIGQQGGVIYKSQGGFVLDPKSDNQDFAYYGYQNHTVRYAVSLNPEFNLPYDKYDVFMSNRPPAYPWITFPYNPFKNNSISFVANGLLGFNHLTTLDNAPDSIQSNLKNYTEKKILDCVDFNLLKERGFMINAGIPDAKVDFATQSTIINLKWPLQVTGLSDSQVNLENFQAVHPVKFRNIYSRSRNLIDSEVSSLDFNMSQQNFIDFHDIGRQGTISVLTDSSSLLRGVPYNFTIAIPDRAPALWYLDQKELDGSLACINTKISVGDSFKAQGGGTSGSPCQINIDIPLKAMDPDEQNFQISMLTSEKKKASSYIISDYDLSKCMVPFEISASDAGASDCQQVCVRIKSNSACPVDCVPGNCGVIQ